MTTIEERRRVEVAKYERPGYTGMMVPWRQGIVSDWLADIVAHGWDYLDVGCGKGETHLLAKRHGLRWRGCDVIESLCGDGIDLLVGAHDLPYPDDQFHVLSCTDVMEHILEEDVPAVLGELSRVTKSAILLGISRRHLKPGKPYHITIKSEAWWMDKIHDNMEGDTKIVYADRVKPIKQPYLFVEVTK